MSASNCRILYESRCFVHHLQRWNDTLSGLAQQTAEKCDFNTGFTTSHYMGENTLSTPASITSSYADLVETQWFAEYQSYDYASGSCSRVCSHYTQVRIARIALLALKKFALLLSSSNLPLINSGADLPSATLLGDCQEHSSTTRYFSCADMASQRKSSYACRSCAACTVALSPLSSQCKHQGTAISIRSFLLGLSIQQTNLF